MKSAETVAWVEEMSDVFIQKVETRYRLPRSLRAAQRRLDQLTRSVVEAACAEAIRRLGLPEESEVCLRNVFVPVSLRLDTSDKSVIDQWSAVLAEEIAESIRQGSTRRAVVYQSRRQALIDMAQSVARGDLRRRWAWQQLGLWQSQGEATERLALVELVHALCGQPEMIVPALNALAVAGELPMIARRLSQAQWESLASAVLVERGATYLLRQSSSALSPSIAREVWRVIKRSRVLRAMASSIRFAETSESVRRAIAVIAVLDVQPALIRSKQALELIDGIAEVTSLHPQVLREEVQESPGRDSVDEAWAGRDSIDEASPARDSVDEASAQEDSVRKELGKRVAHTEPPSELREDRQPLDLRQRGFTRFGGLLFLIPVLEDLNLPEAILDHAVLGARDFQWVLHQLALEIVDVAPNDPAALAFAGLSPTAEPPSANEEPASDVESEALRQLRETILVRLRSLLELDDATNLIDFVCSRRAEIVADPGWIEVKLSLDEVSAEVRRAGLDLDPGYVSWLGVVLKFIYE